MQYYTAERKKELLTLEIAWIDLPGGERQIPYDLTYKWNLINKTNKQAK